MSAVAVREPRLTFGGTLRSEWIKLRSLRSTAWSYLILVVLTVGLSALVAVAIPTDGSGMGGPNQGAAEAQPTASVWLMIATIGVTFSQLVIVVLGALVITGEYGTGMIRSTFAAVPDRLSAIAAKALVFGVVTALVAGLALVAATFIAAGVLDARGLDIELGDQGVWWAIARAIGYLTLLGLLSLAIGAIIRVSAGGIASALGLVLVVPTVFQILGLVLQTQWPQNVAAFLPSSAGGRMYAYEPAASFENEMLTLDGNQGLLVLVAWVIVAGIAAAVLVKRRDA